MSKFITELFSTLNKTKSLPYSMTAYQFSIASAYHEKKSTDCAEGGQRRLAVPRWWLASRTEDRQPGK